MKYNKQRYRRNIVAILFIIITSIIVLFQQFYKSINEVHDIEDLNGYYWQKYMNESEFASLQEGMSYMDVVSIAKGGGEEVLDEVFVWHDELLMTQAYEIHFENDKLIEKKVIEKRGYSTRF